MRSQSLDRFELEMLLEIVDGFNVNLRNLQPDLWRLFE